MALIHVPLPLPFIHSAAARAIRGLADLPTKHGQPGQWSSLQPSAAGRDCGTVWSRSVKTQSSNRGSRSPAAVRTRSSWRQAAPPLLRAAPPCSGQRGWGKHRRETADIWGTPRGGTAQQGLEAGPHALELPSCQPQGREG